MVWSVPGPPYLSGWKISSLLWGFCRHLEWTKYTIIDNHYIIHIFYQYSYWWWSTLMVRICCRLPSSLHLDVCAKVAEVHLPWKAQLENLHFLGIKIWKSSMNRRLKSGNGSFARWKGVISGGGKISKTPGQVSYKKLMKIGVYWVWHVHIVHS